MDAIRPKKPRRQNWIRDRSSRTNGNSNARQQRRKRGGFHTEETQNCDDENRVENYVKSRSDITHDGGVEELATKHLCAQSQGKLDQSSTDDEDRDCTQDLNPSRVRTSITICGVML